MPYCTEFKRHGECDLQFDLYFLLRNALHPLGFRVRPEVGMPSDLHRSGWMRVDIAVTFRAAKSTWIACVIEVKREGKARPAPGSRQARAYIALNEYFQIPVFFVNSSRQLNEQVRRIVSAVLEQRGLVQDDGTPLELIGATSGIRTSASPGQASEGQHTATA